LPAAQAGANGADAKYIVGQLQVQIGLGTGNTQLQSAGVDAMLASGSALPTQLLPLYNNQARFAADAGDIAKADRALDQVVALTPNDPLAIPRAAQLWVDRNNVAHALEYYRHAISAQEAAGRPVPPEARRNQLALAYRTHSPETLALSRAYLATSPSVQGWHDALAIYRELNPNADDRLKLDIYRLMRAAGALMSERDYVEYADLANGGAMFGEVKTVLEAGFARNVITPANAAGSRAELNSATQRAASDRTSLASERTSALAGSNGGAALRVGDAFFSYGDYGQAAELYRAALQKGGQDANLVNTRLGAALALAGQRAEAETAFRAVTGPRAELAQLWLFWLSSRPA
jgi:tetratricopeptide (TPR) repeat protein